MRLRDGVIFALQLGCVAAAVWLLIQPDPEAIKAALFLLASLAALVSGCRGYWRHSPLVLAVAVAQVLALLWFLVALRELYLWAFATSFGSLAKVSDQRFLGVSPFVVFFSLLREYSPGLLVTVVALAIAGSIRLTRIGSTVRVALRMIGVAILMLLPMLLIYSITGTSDMRRIMPAMFLLNVGLILAALSNEGTLRRARLLAVLALTAIQTANVMATGMNVHRPWVSEADFWSTLPSPFVGVDPNPTVLDGILRLGVTHGRIAAFTFCYRDYVNCERSNLPIFEPMALWTVAQARNLPIDVHFMGNLDFTKPETLSEQIKASGFDYVLIDMFDKPADVNWQDDYVIHTNGFLKLYQHGLPKGLTDLGCFYDLGRAICLIRA